MSNFKMKIVRVGDGHVNSLFEFLAQNLLMRLYFELSILILDYLSQSRLSMDGPWKR